MNKGLAIYIYMIMLFCLPVTVKGQARYSGYYKDILMDSGIQLNTYSDLPVADSLGLTMDIFSTDDDHLNRSDSLAQTAFFAGSDKDHNGALLYPDGSPRYRVLYVNGGKSVQHGRSLGEAALGNIRRFVASGGSYVGSCAGAYLSGKGVISDGEFVEMDYYTGVWPGFTVATELEKSATGMVLEKKSPLEKYYDFDEDRQIDSIRHNGGCYPFTGKGFPKGTQILARYVADTISLRKSIDGKPSIWAYKASPLSGRVVVTGSHPERAATGSRLGLFCAMFRYALDGNAEPRLKATLQNGQRQEMVSESDPSCAPIGDRQFHHYCINVPKDVKEITIKLQSHQWMNNFDLYLYAQYGDFAWNDTAMWCNTGRGVDKSLSIQFPMSGKLYISVFCATTVDSCKGRNGDTCQGRTDVLNGVPYTICATFENN